MTWCDLLTDNVVIWSSNWIATCHSKIDRSLINSVCIRIPSAPVLQSEEEMSKALFSFFPFLGVKTYLCLRRIAERNIFQFRTAEFSELYTHTQGERFSQATTHIPMHCQTSTDQRNHQNLAEKILGGSCNSSTFYLWMIDTSCCLTCIRTSALTNLGFELRMALLLVCVVLLYTIIQR